MVNATTSTLGQGSLFGQLMNVGGALFLLLAVLFAGFYLMRRLGPKAGFGGFSKNGLDMRLEGQMAIGPRRSILVVRVDGRRLVLGVCEQSIRLLTELDNDAARKTTEGNADARRAENFAQAMQQAGTDGDRG